MEPSAPWESIRLYTRRPIFLRPFQLHPNTLPHVHTPEEQQLHDCRSRITQYEESVVNGRNWEYYKKVVNPCELVYTQKKYATFPDSLCFLKPLSRSYFKMVEMMDLIDFFKLFPGETIRTAHVCEGPGGFIEALFDEAGKKGRKIQTSVAMTLKSKRTNIPGWKRASYFLQKNKNVHILFGEDETGDIIRPENQQYFIDTIAEGGKVHVYTADGGFDFSCDYMKQEEMVFPLLLASTKIGLEVLKVGGVFVLKLFDYYYRSTLDLIHLLSTLFDEWTLYKPGMSRPCNPEHYFIGKGFTGCSEEILDAMRLWCSIVDHQQPLDSLFVQEEPVDEMIRELRHKSFQIQTEYLERVFHMIEKNDDALIQQHLQQNEKTSYNWCVRFNVPMHPHRRRLIEE
jgi:23S rRNA U2552 (ribose-2'-O)-methylase RlmE/FtsJ